MISYDEARAAIGGPPADWAKDRIYLRTKFVPSFLDRVRLLFQRTWTLSGAIDCEHEPGKTGAMVVIERSTPVSFQLPYLERIRFWSHDRGEPS